MMERSGCWTGDWKGGHGKRPQKRVSDWNSNLGDRDWDYQMEILESIIERVEGLVPGKVSGNGRWR